VGCRGVGSASTKADGAGVCDVGGGKGLREGRLPEVEDARRGYGVAEAVGAGGLDAVEYAGTEDNGGEEVFGVGVALGERFDAKDKVKKGMRR